MTRMIEDQPSRSAADFENNSKTHKYLEMFDGQKKCGKSSSMARRWLLYDDEQLNSC